MAKTPYEISGRTALVTGAARGIGAETAKQLHALGANVALVGLEADLLEELSATLGDRATYFEADVTDAGALEKAVAGTVERFGGLDISIANAGIHFIGAIATAPVEQLEREIDVNLYGVVRTTRAVLPQILERKGYLLNVASLAAASHAPLMGSYAASKAGVEGWTNSLRIEVAPYGARAGCAYFGFIDTDLVKHSVDHPTTQTLMERVLPGFIRNPIPVSRAGNAIVDGVRYRKARVWAPRYVGPALMMRGIIQPLTERQAMREARLKDAIELADPAKGNLGEQDSKLGIAVPAGDKS